MADEILFISDCHLDARRPQVTQQLLGFLRRRAATARQLYILGDLFEVWLGDDDPAEDLADVISALTSLAERTEISFIAGNRDFLLGSAFAERVGMRLLEEPEILDLGGRRVALMHGDLLCTDDHDYQAFRREVRGPAWQSQFLARSLDDRRQVAAQLRSDSNDAMASKPEAIMDVNQQAVVDSFEQLQVDVIVHGHTHRPAVHHLAGGKTRYVLGDWQPGPSYISWTAGQDLQLHDARV